MKVLLVNPPHGFADSNPFKKAGLKLPPLGLLYVASALRAGMPRAEIKVLDAPALGLTAGDIGRQAGVFKPDLAGFTFYTGNVSNSKAAVRAVKTAVPGVFAVAGGPHATLLPETCLDAADAAITGEGELPFLELARALEKRGPLGAVPSLVRRVDGEILRGAPAARPDPDLMPPPARDLVDLRLYRPSPAGYLRLPMTTMVTSRGCPFACAFCSKILGTEHRAQSPENTLDEIRSLTKEYGIREISFQDDIFTLDRARVIKLCSLLKGAGLDLTWSCMTRVDLVDAGLLAAMRAAGCFSIAYGVDAVLPDSAWNMNKGYRPGAPGAAAAVRLTKAAGIETRAYYLLGWPGDTRASLDRALAEIKRIDADFVFFALPHPFPGTALLERAAREGLLLKDEAALLDAADNAEPLVRLDGFTPPELIKYLMRAYRGYYLRPGYLSGRLFSPRWLRLAARYAGASLVFLARNR